jgi:hypothetical protein
MNTARRGLSGTGTQTAALAIGGFLPPYTGATESYNGSAWTTVNSLTTARGYAAGFGTQTASLLATGTSPLTAVTESWNGTNWTNLPSVTTARNSLKGVGTQSSGVIFGGSTPGGSQNVTEKWTGEVATAGSKTLTTS